MYDYLRRYDSEVHAVSDPLVKAYRIEEGWNDAVVIPAVRVYTIGEEVEIVDTEWGFTEVVRVREYLPYWYLWITSPKLMLDLVDTSMVVALRESRAIIASRVPSDDWVLYHCDPVIAGSNYPFGVVSDNNESV